MTPEDRTQVERDWITIAKLAGEHGIRYRTNSALEQFLAALSAPAEPSAALSEREALLQIRSMEPEELWDFPDRYTGERKACMTLDASNVFEIIDAALSASSPAVVGELEAGKDELRRLMDNIWRAEYRNEAPDWKPLTDLVGMVTQIDNMYAGIRSQRDEALAALTTTATESVEEKAVRHDERKKIIAAGCIHTTKAQARADERPDIQAWQEAQSEWFDATICEIVSEYAEWRDRISTPSGEDGHG